MKKVMRTVGLVSKEVIRDGMSTSEPCPCTTAIWVSNVETTRLVKVIFVFILAPCVEFLFAVSYISSCT
jgi:hypothetical protein